MPAETEHSLERPQRWDTPFDTKISSHTVARILAGTTVGEEEEIFSRIRNVLARIRTAPVFSGVDPERFPRHLPLDGILLNDCRLLLKEQDEIIVREGDYGNSAFVVLRGSVRLIVDNLPSKLLGRNQTEKKGPLAMLRKALTRSKIPEKRVHHSRRFEENARREAAPGIFLQDAPRVLEGRNTIDIQAGEMFGEIAALGRSPRTATVIAAEKGTEILEIRWQGLRDLMNFAPAFKEHVEERFRRFGLSSLLKNLDFIKRLNPADVAELVAGTRFERHGRFDWYGSYQKILSATSASDRLRNEPLIIRESEYIDGMVIVRGGFVRVSRRHHKGETTVSYLGKGQIYGLGELYHNHLEPADILPAQHTLRAIGYVDLLVIPTQLVEKLIIPHLTPEETALLAPPAENKTTEKISTNFLAEKASDRLGPDIMEFLMDKRTINGSAAMLIDLDRCTRCDDCVRACASTHDGNPRFIRYGDRENSIQVTQACLHCHDPICMIPCPTGAIHREASGEVVINDNTCIGCSACADNCPYDNIQMVDIRDDEGMPQFPVSTEAGGKRVNLTAAGVIKRATKCDLCHDQLAGPACVRACPHDALQRFDMQNINSLAKWLSR
ncbi:cyclic nucleotide-binding domain-containing protein [Luteolibacter algae]|uniref:Cyclic nucleotide-binding domain-containing protein n=1 Tax=Luteolibacter algae TaxID=454151 RepID=A0ABW5D6W4_9BACT